VRLGVCVGRRRFRADAVAAFDLVGVGELLAGEDAGVRAKAEHLVSEPAVADICEQRLGVGRERGRVHERLGVGLLLQLERAVVRVDEPVDVPAEPQAEQEVALRGRHSVNLIESGVWTCAKDAGRSSSAATPPRRGSASPVSSHDDASAPAPLIVLHRGPGAAHDYLLSLTDLGRGGCL